MKKIYNSILAIAFTLGLTNAGLAQVSTYAFTQSSGTYNAITGNVVGTTTSDDQVFVDPSVPAGTTAGSSGVGLPIGFNLTFNGNVYDRFGINNNGWIFLGQSALGSGAVNSNSSSGYNAISATSTATAPLQNRIAAFARDLQGQTGSSLSYTTLGSAPNQSLVVQWSGYRRWNSTGENFSFQIVLEEGSNAVTVIYAAFISGTTGSNTCQVGLRGNSNTDYNNRSVVSGTSTWATSTAGVSNAATCAFFNTLLPASGQTYRWVPPTPCSGTPNAGLAIASLTSVCTPTNVNLNLSGSTSGVTGLTYQWLSSPDGSAWSTIASATNIATTQSVTTSTYYQCVVSCGASSATSTPVQVQIATTTTNTIPYFEGFEGISAAGQLPNCSWTKTGDWTTNIGTQSNNRFPRTGTKYAHTQWSTIAGGDYIYTNGIQLTAGVTYSANAFYVVDGAAGWDEVSMLYGTSQSTTGLVNIASQYSLTNTAYQPIAGTFSVASSGIYYLAFKAVAPTTTPWYLSIDDINLDVAPACTTPPVAGIITGPTTVTVGSTNLYSSTGTTGNVQWYSAPALSGPWNPIAGATALTQTITAVSAGTVYYGFIASNPGCPNDTTDVQYQVTVLFPGNDVCDAIPLTLGTSAPYALFGATTQTGEVAPPATGLSTNTGWGNSTLNNTMWYTFTAPASGYVSIQSPGFDTQLALWKAAACGDLLSASTATLLAANDDDANYTTHSGALYSSYLTAACLTPGATYYIQLDSYSAASSTETTSIVITDLGTLDASFTGLAANYCLTSASSSLTPATNGGIFTINTSTTSVTSFSPATAGVGTHTVTYSIFGCQTMSTTVVANTPTVSAANATICAGSSATLTATGATNYTWTPSGDLTATSVVTPTSNATYTVTGETSGCSSTGTVSVDVTATPILTVSASSSAVCASSSATLTVTGATNYTWTSGGNTSTEVVTPSSNSTYTVTGETSGCSSTGTVSVDVNSIPSVVALASQTVLCDDGSTGAAILTASTSATSYTWSEGSTTMSISVTPTITTDYTVTVEDLGCTNTATVSVMVTNCTGVKEITTGGISIFPNPNNGLVTIAIHANFTSNTTLEVYDALGKLVIKEPLTNEETTINTSKLTDGIYIYKIINNNKEAKIGRMIKQ